jgi:hypothetical protein
MPSNYVRESETNNLTKLEDALSKSSVNYCSLKSTFQDYDGILYHKKDTHWNNHGALLGYNAILDSINVPHNDYLTTSFESVKDWSGDLDGMLFPNSTNLDYQIEYDIDYTYSYTSKLRTTNLDDTTITTANDSATGSLLMFRDSFGRAILPFMAENFNSAEFSRAVPVNLSKTQADVVVHEIVERNIGTLLDSAPVMLAQPCDSITVSSSSTYSDSNVIRVLPEDSLDAYKVYGKVACEPSSYEDFNIYVVVNGTTVFEAFPIFESTLLEDYTLNSGELGFSVLVPKEYLDTTSLDINVLVYQNGVEVSNCTGNPSLET